MEELGEAPRLVDAFGAPETRMGLCEMLEDRVRMRAFWLRVALPPILFVAIGFHALFAAGAYLGDGASFRAALVAQDVLRWLLIIGLLLSALAAVNPAVRGFLGNLLGTRMVINELVAYSALGAQKAMLDPRSFTIATFALCGFAYLSSIGIQIGGIGALAPNKRDQLAQLGFRAMIAGTMANLMSAAIVGLLIRS